VRKIENEAEFPQFMEEVINHALDQPPLTINRQSHDGEVAVPVKETREQPNIRHHIGVRERDAAFVVGVILACERFPRGGDVTMGLNHSFVNSFEESSHKDISWFSDEPFELYHLLPLKAR
jgi:hypothetical protein